MSISSTEMALLAVRSMLKEAQEEAQKALDRMHPVHSHWTGRVAGHNQVIRYLENALEQESNNKVSLAESLALMNKDG